ERADLLRAAVVGVVVARRQGVGTEDDAALHLVAEPGATRRGHDALRGHGAVLGLHAQAEAHAVELGEVARRLRRHDEVVRAERVLEVRAGDLDDLRAQAPQEVERLREPRAHALLVALAVELLDDADAQAREVARRALHSRVDERRPTTGDGRRVPRV